MRMQSQGTCSLLDHKARCTVCVSTEGQRDDDFPRMLKGKKVLLATESLGPINGVTRTTSMLIDYLRDNDVTVAVAAPEVTRRHAQSDPRVHVDIRLQGYALPYNPDLSVVYPLRIDRIFERTFRPDLVYLASPASVGFQILLQLPQLWNAPPVVCNFQTDLSHYSEIIFPAGMDRYAVWLLGLVQGFLFRQANVHRVLHPSNGVKHYLEKIGVQPNKLVRLGRGVDTIGFDPAHRDEQYRRQLAPRGEIILITVSRLAPEKGFEFLSQAAIKLANEGLAFKLVVVGGNQNPMVEASVQNYFDPIRHLVTFTGFLTGAALGRAYASADVFLHCSITETFGLVVLEAMASGVPVIARDQGGPSEIVQDGKTGFLTAPHDLDGFVRSVRLLCDSKEMMATLASTSRQVALETTWKKINNRAAWQIAATLEQHDRLEAQAASCRSWKNRILAVLCGDKVRALQDRIHVVGALGMISFFWIIAVLPLILYGQLRYRPK